MCPHAAVCVSSCCYVYVIMLLYVSSCCFICVRMLLYMCPHAAIYVAAYYYVCVLTLIYVSSCYYICVLLLLCHATTSTMHVSSYYYMCVLILPEDEVLVVSQESGGAHKSFRILFRHQPRNPAHNYLARFPRLQALVSSLD